MLNTCNATLTWKQAAKCLKPGYKKLRIVTIIKIKIFQGLGKENPKGRDRKVPKYGQGKAQDVVGESPDMGIRESP